MSSVTWLILLDLKSAYSQEIENKGKESSMSFEIFGNTANRMAPFLNDINNYNWYYVNCAAMTFPSYFAYKCISIIVNFVIGFFIPRVVLIPLYKASQLQKNNK